MLFMLFCKEEMEKNEEKSWKQVELISKNKSINNIIKI